MLITSSEYPGYSYTLRIVFYNIPKVLEITKTNKEEVYQELKKLPYRLRCKRTGLVGIPISFSNGVAVVKNGVFSLPIYEKDIQVLDNWRPAFKDDNLVPTFL